MVDPKRIQYSVTCPCGAGITLDARGFGKNLPCGGCKGTVVIAWGRDAKNTESIPVIVRHVPGPGRPVRPAAARSRPTMKTQIRTGVKFLECPCGERNVLMGKGPGETVACCHCDRVHLLEAAPAAEVEPPPHAAPPPPPPPPPRKPLRLGEIQCKCGEVLPPRTSKTGREFACKACGRKGHVVPGQDAKGMPVIDAVFTDEP